MSSNPPSASAVIEPGTRLDRYELLCVLAHGGMANIWLARVQGKLGFNKMFAVKTILPGVAEDPAFKDMFLDEARIASRIEHPNVVHIPDVGEYQGVPYLVMDLVEGEPLYKLPRACEKRGTKMPLGIVLRILADACHGLHAAHELRDETGNLLGVVHRDMSPQNIMVSTSGVSKVIDFGVAKARDRATAQTSAGTLKGKISYMPREQALGQDVDRRADTWALGAVLYYLLTGRPPYKEDNQLATLQMVMNAAPIAPLPTTFPLSLRTLVTRALAHEPAQRFQNAAEMGNALEELMRKLQIVTTHANVATFVTELLGDRIEARKALVQNAVGEAANRERAREALTVPVDLESSDENSSLKQGIVAVPTAIMSAPRLDSSTDLSEASNGSSTSTTAGTFVAPSDAKKPGARWPLVVGAVVGTLGLVGVLLVVVSLKMKPVAHAAAAPAALPPVAQPADPKPAPVTDKPAEPAKTDKAPAPIASAAPKASSAPSSTAKTAGFKWTPAPAPSAKTATAKPAGAAPAKKMDDEAGF